MGKVIQIEVPDWVDEDLVRRVINMFVEVQELKKRKAVEEIEKILSKSKLTDDEARELEKAIKESLWKDISELL